MVKTGKGWLVETAPL